VSAAPASAATTSAHDPFYAPPANLASLAPGTIIRSRRVQTRGLPNVRFAFKSSQVLYRSTDSRGAPVAVATTVMLPFKRPAKNRKLISYQLAYNGLGPKCKPSYILQTGWDWRVDPETLLVQHALFNGWAVAMPDHEGPDTMYMDGPMGGHAVLDGIRAVEQFEPAGLDQGSATQVGMIGYSGGAQPTAWANELAGTYAPELNIKGASLGGTPANPALFIPYLEGGVSAGIGLAALAGMMRAHPEVNFDQYLNDRGRHAFRLLEKQCLSEFVFEFPFQKLRAFTNVADVLSIPAVQKVLKANTLGQHPPKTPTLITHAYRDEVIDFHEIKQVVDAYCDAGTPVQFITPHSNEHVWVAIAMAGRAFAYLRQRFSGAPAPDTCSLPGHSDGSNPEL
jgi:hypothetical protein